LIAQVIDRLADAISASGPTNAVAAIFTAVQASIAWRITSYAAANHTTSARCLVITGFAEQGTVGTINADPALDVAALVLTTVPVSGAAHATPLLGADTTGSALRVVLTLQALQRLTITQLPHRTIAFLQTLNALVVETVANLTTRTAETVLLVALVTALILNASIASLTRFIVTAALDALRVDADTTVTAVGVLGAAIFTKPDVVSLSYFAVLSQITLCRVAALIAASTPNACMIDRALSVDAAALLAAVVNASLSFNTFVVDAAACSALVLVTAILPLGAAFVVSAARNTATIIGADLTDVAELIPAATLSALSLSADFTFGTASGFDATCLAAAVDTDLT
jgi:hypothetical protein